MQRSISRTALAHHPLTLRSTAPAAAPSAWGRDQVLVVVAAMALVACNVGVRQRSAWRGFGSQRRLTLHDAQAENCFGTWLYTYAVQGAGLGPGVAATAVSLFWGAFTAGRLIAIPVSARLPPGAILLGSLPLAVLGPVIALLARGSVGALYVAAVAAGFGICTGATTSGRAAALHRR